MKKFLAIALLFAACAAAETLTPADREKAIRHLNETKAAFLASIQGLSAAQWSFKPAPEVWSVAEVAEHITVSEGTILDLIEKKILASPADPQLLAEAKGKDALVLKAVPDRSVKAKAPEFLIPKARWTQPELPEVFNSRRAKTLEFISTTQEDLRGHVLPHPMLKALDAYQWVLLLSAHSQRHTAQIEEVKANPNFPKN